MQNINASAGALSQLDKEETDKTGVRMSAAQRSALMQSLMSSHGMRSIDRQIQRQCVCVDKQADTKTVCVWIDRQINRQCVCIQRQCVCVWE